MLLEVTDDRLMADTVGIPTIPQITHTTAQSNCLYLLRRNWLILDRNLVAPQYLHSGPQLPPRLRPLHRLLLRPRDDLPFLLRPEGALLQLLLRVREAHAVSDVEQLRIGGGGSLVVEGFLVGGGGFRGYVEVLVEDGGDAGLFGGGVAEGDGDAALGRRVGVVVDGGAVAGPLSVDLGGSGDRVEAVQVAGGRRDGHEEDRLGKWGFLCEKKRWGNFLKAVKERLD